MEPYSKFTFLITYYIQNKTAINDMIKPVARVARARPAKLMFTFSVFIDELVNIVSNFV